MDFVIRRKFILCPSQEITDNNLVLLIKVKKESDVILCHLNGCITFYLDM